jgi:hypothetical protein
MGTERERVAGFGRMEDGLRQSGDWYRWGPYVSERQWGTVREDYSANGEAWDYLPHDHARSRAYRWGEDGLAGFSDVEQRLCLGLALWNGRDPILKERAFGLTGGQGNHGEDVKEYWWYLDAVPSHAWNTWRYHYPQGPYPYQELIDVNRSRDRYQPEYELVDTGAFDENRYWIVEVTYAKGGPDDLLMAIKVTNAGPAADTLHVLPTCWFRNTWSWDAAAERPSMAATSDSSVAIGHPFCGQLELLAEAGAGGAAPAVLFCENETKRQAAVRDGGRPALPQGRHQRPRGRRDGDRQPGTHRDQVRVLVPGHRGRGRDDRVAAAAAPRGGRRARYDGEAIGRAPGGTGGRPPGGRQNGCVRHRVRRGGRGAAGRGRRVLRGADPRVGERGRGDGDAPGVRRAAVEQAALLLRREALA